MGVASPLRTEKMDIPESMKAELAAWSGDIGLKGWIACKGSFALAVGYSAVFWPEFVVYEDYLLRKDFSLDALRGFANSSDSTRESVEWVMNHLHLLDIQHPLCEDATKDKLLMLGNILKEIYEIKLKAQFPERPCEVEFYVPDDDDLFQYQLSFWQRDRARDAD